MAGTNRSGGTSLLEGDLERAGEQLEAFLTEREAEEGKTVAEPVPAA